VSAPPPRARQDVRQMLREAQDCDEQLYDIATQVLSTREVGMG